MPKVVREDIDNQNAVLTVSLKKADYEPKFVSELDKYRKQGYMKGFRKGRTPISVLKKMYGKAVLVEVVNEMLQKELLDFLEKEKIDILGQPLPSKEQEEIGFNVKDMKDYVFKFDLGLAPQFELKGMSEENKFVKYTLEISDEEVEEELEAGRKELGEEHFPEEDIQQGDLLQLIAKELEDGQLKEDGIDSEFSILLSNFIDEDIKKELLSKKKGDVHKIDLFQLEKNRSEDFVRKHLLKLDEDDEREAGREYEVSIEKVVRKEPAPLDEEFFNKYFGEGVVSNEEEAKEKIRKGIAAQYDESVQALLDRDLQENLMEKNPLALPDEFLRRWIIATNEKAAEELTDIQYELFAKNLQWDLIKNKVVKMFELRVTEEEVIEAYKRRINRLLGDSVPYNDEFVTRMATRMLEDEKQVKQFYQQLLIEKIFDAIGGAVTVEPKAVSVEELEKLIDGAKEKDEAAGSLHPEEEE